MPGKGGQVREEDRIDWAALAALHCLGRREKDVLLALFGGEATALLAAGPRAWSCAGLPAGAADALAAEIGTARRRARSDFARARKAGAEPVALPEEEMPPLVRAIPDPPFLLYRRGRCGEALLRGLAVAIVGARRATEYGMAMARTLAADLGTHGLAIVSGAARGVDGAAHAGVLAAGGETAAVLGCGIDVAYPREHAALLGRIAESAGVWSEFPPGTPPLRGNFPVRNRLISGLSRAVVVVEASERSGSLITARLAADQGREVLAVPSNATSRGGRGANRLIRDGACLVLGAEDVVAELPEDVRHRLVPVAPASETSPAAGGGEGARVLAGLRVEEGTGLDHLAERTGLPAERLLPILLELELQGLVERREGSRYVRVARPGPVVPGG